jgi:hypothetical protein
MSNVEIPVGRVLRASTRGFTVGCRVMQPDIPSFGSFVRAEARAPECLIFGLITDVAVEDDLFVRRFIIADPPEEVVRDQRENRQVPIEVSVLAIGYCQGDDVVQRIPPQPPVTMDYLYPCTAEQVVGFTGCLDYFRLVLDAPGVAADGLLAASLQIAARARPPEERETFLVAAGRELARLLSADLLRLDCLLQQIRLEG